MTSSAPVNEVADDGRKRTIHWLFRRGDIILRRRTATSTTSGSTTTESRLDFTTYSIYPLSSRVYTCLLLEVLSSTFQPNLHLYEQWAQVKSKAPESLRKMSCDILPHLRWVRILWTKNDQRSAHKCTQIKKYSAGTSTQNFSKLKLYRFNISLPWPWHC